MSRFLGLPVVDCALFVAIGVLPGYGAAPERKPVSAEAEAVFCRL